MYYLGRVIGLVSFFWAVVLVGTLFSQQDPASSPNITTYTLPALPMSERPKAVIKGLQLSREQRTQLRVLGEELADTVALLRKRIRKSHTALRDLMEQNRFTAQAAGKIRQSILQDEDGILAAEIQAYSKAFELLSADQQKHLKNAIEQRLIAEDDLASSTEARDSRLFKFEHGLSTIRINAGCAAGTASILPIEVCELIGYQSGSSPTMFFGGSGIPNLDIETQRRTLPKSEGLELFKDDDFIRPFLRREFKFQLDGEEDGDEKSQPKNSPNKELKQRNSDRTNRDLDELREQNRRLDKKYKELESKLQQLLKDSGKE